jgi:hypothetical protein
MWLRVRRHIGMQLPAQSGQDLDYLEQRRMATTNLDCPDIRTLTRQHRSPQLEHADPQVRR